MFNLRGADVSFNPVFVSFALISQQQATLFVALDKVDASLRAALEQDGVTLRDYSEAAAALREVPDGASLQIDPARVTVGLLDNLGSGVKLVEGLNPTTLAKSRKAWPTPSTSVGPWIRTARRSVSSSPGWKGPGGASASPS